MKNELLAFADYIECQAKHYKYEVGKLWQFQMEGTTYKVSCKPSMSCVYTMTDHIREGAKKNWHTPNYRAAQYKLPTMNRGKAGLESFLADNDIANAVPLAAELGVPVYLWSHNDGRGMKTILANNVSEFPDDNRFIVCKGIIAKSWCVMHKDICITLARMDRNKQRAIESARAIIQSRGWPLINTNIDKQLSREDTPYHTVEIDKYMAEHNPQPSGAVVPVVRLVPVSVGAKPIQLSLTAEQIINALGAM